MKVIALVLIIAATANAQTNLGSVYFTNKYGGLIQGDVRRADNQKIQVMHEGIITNIKLSDTPSHIQSRFGYDAEAEAAARTAELKRRNDEAARKREASIAEWLKTPLPKADLGSVNVEVKVVEKNEVFWQFSYLLIIRNPTTEDSVRDFTVNYLDKDGFVLDYSMEYAVKTKAQSTNTVRGTSLLKVPKAFNYHRPEVMGKKRS